MLFSQEVKPVPGPISDSYDPEFSTGANANDVREGIRDVVDRIGEVLGEKLLNIVEIVHSENLQNKVSIELTEQELRIIRFGLNRAIETI